MKNYLKYLLPLPVFMHDRKFIKRYSVETEARSPREESSDMVGRVTEALTAVEPVMKADVLRYAEIHRQRIAFDIDIIRRYISRQDRIIDIGAYPFLLTASLKRLGYDIYGLDIDPHRMGNAIAQEGLRVIGCNVETQALPYENDYFDAVIFHEIFEHLRINPITTMKEVSRVLKSGAKLFLSTPNLKSVNGVINFLYKDIAYSCVDDLYQEYAKLDYAGHAGHVREYTVKEVCIFLEQTGFKVEKIIFRGANAVMSGPKRCLARLAPHLSPFISIIATAQK